MAVHKKPDFDWDKEQKEIAEAVEKELLAKKDYGKFTVRDTEILYDGTNFYVCKKPSEIANEIARKCVLTDLLKKKPTD